MDETVGWRSLLVLSYDFLNIWGVQNGCKNLLGLFHYMKNGYITLSYEHLAVIDFRIIKKHYEDLTSGLNGSGHLPPICKEH